MPRIQSLGFKTSFLRMGHIYIYIDYSVYEDVTTMMMMIAVVMMMTTF